MEHQPCGRLAPDRAPAYVDHRIILGPKGTENRDGGGPSATRENAAGSRNREKLGFHENWSTMVGPDPNHDAG
jgi:hypothetical protein